MVYTTIESPLGPLLISGDDTGLRNVSFQAGTHALTPSADWVRDDAALVRAARQLREYFEGARRVFDLPLAPAGTRFQLEVWRALILIPYGQTISYGELARRVGNPKGSRAVGAANGRNPLPLVIPCHRVIASNGALTGYGGGLWIKEALLNAERRGGPVRPAGPASSPDRLFGP